jgi:hypothetical protein
MKQPGTLVRHDDREYLLVEGGYNAATRAVILLARPLDTRFPRNEEVAPLRWGAQGEWQPVARWTEQELRIPDPRHEPQRELAVKLIDDYRATRRPRPTVAWAAEKDGSFAGTLEVSLPMGFAAYVWPTKERAEAGAAGGALVPVENLAMFFTHLVREGYSGAVWNAEQPVFFCVDEQQDLQFLRIGKSEAGDRVVMEILDTTDAWSGYDGAEEIEFIDNTEACDARLVAAVGKQPVIGWPKDGRLFSAGPEFGAPIVISSGEEQDAVPHAVLFTSEAAATEFIEDAEQELKAFPVNDLGKFLTQTELEGCVAALNPGGHRASSGILWSDGERVVLDSFSGFWKLGESGFEPAE